MRPPPRTAAPVTADGRRTRRRALAAAMAWVLLLALGQLLVGGRLVIVPWLALGPLAASLVVGWRLTSVVAATSVLAVAVLSADTGDLLQPSGVIRQLGCACLAGFAVLSAHVRVRREARVRHLAQVAAVAQTAILHPVPARLGRAVMASRYVSATSDALVGGDLFDVVSAGPHLRLVLGDARGKGLDALHTSAAVLSAFRHAAPRTDLALDEVAREVEAALLPRLSPEDFVTAVLCELHPDGSIDLVLCGHPGPLLLAPGAAPAPLGHRPCPPLGLGVDPVVEHAQLREGERLLFFTDGLVEARDADGEFFDLELTAADLHRAPSRRPTTAGDLDAALDRLLAGVRSHVGGQITDDVAVLLLELLAPQGREAGERRGAPAAVAGGVPAGVAASVPSTGVTPAGVASPGSVTGAAVVGAAVAGAVAGALVPRPTASPDPAPDPEAGPSVASAL